MLLMVQLNYYQYQFFWTLENNTITFVKHNEINFCLFLKIQYKALPVISLGLAKPIILSRVGAISASLPS